MTDWLGTPGFGTHNVDGDEFTTASVVIDQDGLHLAQGAIIRLTDAQGGIATIDGKATHPDLPLYGLANADFGDGPPDPTMNIMAGVGPYERTVRNITGLVAYWRLGETSGTAAREEVNGRVGTYTGGFTLGADGALVTPEMPSGLRDPAVTLNGTTGYVTIPTATALHPGDTFSIVAWVKKALDGTIMTILSAGASDYELVFTTSNALLLQKQGVGTSILSSVRVTADGRWHQVAITKDGATNSVYIDGVADTGATTTNLTIVASAAAIDIGRRVTTADRYFNGSIDEVALFNVALTAENVSDLYTVGTDPYYDPGLAGSNFMPNWRFVQSSNMNITAKQVRDTASPSGSNLRFTIAAGQTTDEAFVEQIVDVGGSRERWTGDVSTMSMLRVTATANGFQGSLHLQYLTIDGALVGNATSHTLAWTADGSLANATTYGHATSGASPPATAAKLRVRLILKRSTAATSATGTFDFTDARRDPARPYVLIAESNATDPGIYSPGIIRQAGGALYLAPDGGSDAYIRIENAGNLILFAPTGGYVSVQQGHIETQETAAPSTPAPGQFATYSDTSGVFHTLNDAGVDFPLGPSGTYTPRLAYATVGSSTWAPTLQVGRYTVIGPLCFLDFEYTGVPTNGTGSGNLQLMDLPFTAATLANAIDTGSCSFGGYTKAGFTWITPAISSAATFGLFRASGTAVAVANLAVGDIPTGGTVLIRGAIVYHKT